MARLPEGIYPQARALNYGNRGRSISVSVTMPDGSTQSVRAVASNNINATRCCVVVDADGRATVINPADTGRSENKRRGRFVYGRPAVALPIRRKEPTGLITWWALDWIDNGSGTEFVSGVIAADPAVPDDFFVYTKLGASGSAPRYFRYLAGITENTDSKTLTVNAIKITPSVASNFGVQIYWDRAIGVYPDPTPGSYSSSQDLEFFAQVPSYTFGFSPNDGGFDSSSTVSFTFTIPTGRTIIEVSEFNLSEPADIAEPPVPSWTFGATLS